MYNRKLDRNLLLLAGIGLLVIAGVAAWLLMDGKPDNRPVVEARTGFDTAEDWRR